MPIFEYECAQCGHKMEFLEKSKTRNKHICEKCGSPAMKKLLSGFSVGQGGQDSGACPTGTCPLS